MRYWQATTAGLPNLATVFGDHAAVEVHAPLEFQLPTYLAARQIAPAQLPGYVIRDDFRIVIPSNTPAGRYTIRVATIARRLLFIQIDPVSPAELLPREFVLGAVDVASGPPGPPPDPLRSPAPDP